MPQLFPFGYITRHSAALPDSIFGYSKTLRSAAAMRSMPAQIFVKQQAKRYTHTADENDNLFPKFRNVKLTRQHPAIPQAERRQVRQMKHTHSLLMILFYSRILFSND